MYFSWLGWMLPGLKAAINWVGVAMATPSLSASWRSAYPSCPDVWDIDDARYRPLVTRSKRSHRTLPPVADAESSVGFLGFLRAQFPHAGPGLRSGWPEDHIGPDVLERSMWNEPTRYDRVLWMTNQTRTSESAGADCLGHGGDAGRDALVSVSGHSFAMCGG